MTTRRQPSLEGHTTAPPLTGGVTSPGREPIDSTDDLPHARLQAYLETQLDDFRGLKKVTKCSGGQSNPTYLLTTEWNRYVLRRKPLGHLLPSAHVVDREFRVLKALHSSPVPVPRPFLYCADQSVIGSEFYLMEFVDGRGFWDPTLPEVDPRTRAAMYDDMNRVLASLHQLDPNAIGLADYGRPGRYFERQIRRWTEQYRASETEQRTDMERLIDWLPASLPPDDGQVSLVHGDFRLDNMIFDDSGRVIALLDWELSTLGHPFADVAYQCAQWHLPAGLLRGLKGVDRKPLGIPSDEEYVESYCRRRGLAGIPNWHFYLAFSLFRLAAICQGVYRRALDGNASDPSATGFGDRTRVIAAHAVELLPEPNP